MRDIRFRQALSHFQVNDSATSFPSKKINVLFSKQSFSNGTAEHLDKEWTFRGIFPDYRNIFFACFYPFLQL